MEVSVCIKNNFRIKRVVSIVNFKVLQPLPLLLLQSAKAYLGPYQTSMMELLEKMVNINCTCSIRMSKYTSGSVFNLFVPNAVPYGFLVFSGARERAHWEPVG